MSRIADPVLIAGGGIAGLSLALQLARIRQPSVILERREEGDETGAGIQIGPNGTRILEEIGIAAPLTSLVGAPEQIVVRDALTARRLTALPLGRWIEARHGAPYWTIHRADLHRALLDAAKAEPRIALLRGFEVATMRETPAGVEARSGSGQAVTGCALIGADGLWSRIRSFVAPGVAPTYSGRTASRAVAQTKDLPPTFCDRAVGLWLAPYAHVVHYPVRGGAEIAFVVVVEESWQGPDWGAPVHIPHLLEKVASTHAELRKAIGQTAGWRRWALSEMPPLERWSQGPVALVGDAAHPVLPFLAQGGVLALEDTATLARHWARRPLDLPRAFASYAAERMPRAGRVQLESRRNGQRYHWAGPMAWGRNLVLGSAPAIRLMAGYDWLYGHRVAKP